VSCRRGLVKLPARFVENEETQLEKGLRAEVLAPGESVAFPTFAFITATLLSGFWNWQVVVRSDDVETGCPDDPRRLRLSEYRCYTKRRTVCNQYIGRETACRGAIQRFETYGR
jgi:hypothetical protein